MPLRQLIRSSPETMADLLVAADDRYREAEKLLLEQEFDGAIYLFGYAAEMWLKSACFRLRGHRASEPAKAALQTLRRWMAFTAPRVAFTDYHDLGFFAAAVAELRLASGRPLPMSLARDLDFSTTNGLNLEWIVEMRYRRCGLSAAEAWKALSNAWWLKMNWTKLT